MNEPDDRDSACTRYFPIGTSRAISQVRRLLEQVSAFDSNVLITGESGTGKEWAA